MGTIVFHIGFPKTGTTTLQSVLMESDSCAYLGKGRRESLAPSISVDIARAVFFSDSRRFEEAQPPLSEALAEMARQAECLIVSDEAFSFAEYMEIVRHWGLSTTTDHEVIAARLQRLAPEARIMISVRNQLSFLRSFYAQKAKRGLEGVTCEAYVQAQIDRLPNRSMLQALRYDECYAAYARHFGKDAVFVSVFENYIDDYGAYLDHTAGVLGVAASELHDLWRGKHANKAKTSVDSPALKRARDVVPASVRQIVPTSLRRTVRRAMQKPLPPPILSDDQIAELTAYFGPSNSELARLTGFDLAQWDYPLMPS